MLRRLLFDNFWLKLISLLVTLGIYGFIQAEQDREVTVAATIVKKLPSESTRRELMTDIPKTVDVTLKGPWGALESIRRNDELSVSINLEAAQDTEIRFLPEMINGVPPGVEVTRVLPSTLSIKFEDVIDRRVPVQVARRGEPKEGTEIVGRIVVVPAEVNLNGVESLVSTMQFARAEPFDVTGLDEGKHTHPLRLTPPGEGLAYDVQSVEATVEVQRKRATREMDVDIVVVGLPGAKTKPATVNIRVVGDPPTVEALQKESVVARVDPSTDETLDLTKPGTAYLPVLVELEEFEDVTLTPARVFVTW